MKSENSLAYRVGKGKAYILEVAIVNQLHEHKHIDEHLALRKLGDFLRARGSAVQFGLHILARKQGSRLRRECHTTEQVRQVVLEHKQGVAQGVQLSEPFELFG